MKNESSIYMYMNKNYITTDNSKQFLKNIRAKNSFIAGMSLFFLTMKLIRMSLKLVYLSINRQTQMGFEWASKYYKFAFLLKTDDDVFVNVPRDIFSLRAPLMVRSVQTTAPDLD